VGEFEDDLHDADFGELFGDGGDVEEAGLGGIGVLMGEFQEGKVGAFADILAGVAAAAVGDGQAGELGGEGVPGPGAGVFCGAGEVEEFGGFAGTFFEAEDIAGGEAQAEAGGGAQFLEGYVEGGAGGEVVDGEEARGDAVGMALGQGAGGGPAGIDGEGVEGCKAGDEELDRHGGIVTEVIRRGRGG